MLTLELGSILVEFFVYAPDVFWRNPQRCADKPFGLMVSLRTARLLIVLDAATFFRLAGQELGNLLCLFV
eukprot:JP441043.1.p2 GENE.JP441043.1~~JP441043.1.p2  ORF type:complete len:70 (+),score=8.19 JP441043.1:34-243(+)